jgi:hypothetical protein
MSRARVQRKSLLVVAARLPVLALGLAAGLALAAGAARGRGAMAPTAPTGPPEPAKGGAAPARGPVVVELFTSQGCSSCPPADRLLSRLKRDPRLAGEVIPLAFHVDYWNHLGWSDPFSSHLWSQRQQGYAQAFHSNRIYTPQLVINGRTECVGSEEGQVMRRIREALAAEPAAQVTLGTPVVGDSARVAVGARLLRPVPGDGLEVWVALVESGLTTPVRGGENASATLHDDQVVRLMVKALTLRQPAAGAGAAGSESTAEVTLPLDPKWNRSALDLVAFLQDPRSLSIHGAASRPLAAAPAPAAPASP